ncbi:MerR family transcriptional regulator [Micromonospora sp. NPDC049559]|uniref:MerR family transcriptional regulator n=1 Tax=Micromonospora sp. NPDC049559 TaxID=3155923 RepID=UPI003439E25F
MGDPATGLRSVDLARLVGVSTQQIRNYVDAGVLPPVTRSPAGYRRFEARHRRALLTYRALGRGYGWETAKAVLRAVHAGDVPQALARVDAAHAGLHEQRLSLRAVGEALEAVAARGAGEAVPSRGPLRVGELARRLGVRASALRVWESAGLLAPARTPGTGYRSFGPADVRDAQMIKMLRQGRYPLAQIRPILDGLRRTGSSEALRAAIADRQRELARRTKGMLAAAGALHGYLEEFPDPPPGAGRRSEG